jgi:hypothetical protein
MGSGAGGGAYQQIDELMEEFRDHGGRALNLSKSKWKIWLALKVDIRYKASL